MTIDPSTPFGRLPLTYDECRARFERAAVIAGTPLERHPVTARGPAGQELTVDVAGLGPDDARRLLVILSGVHGVEGFIGSALQCDLLERFDATAVSPDVGVLVIHAVNPWGMAWSRRQNESNVDLNRNWLRSDLDPVHNDAYDEVHHVACPATPTMPDVDAVLATAADVVAERGLGWVRDAITAGQYRHPDGLHYGGERTEESNRILEQLAATYRSHWVHLHGDRGDPSHAAAIRDYRNCFTPDDPAWERAAFAGGRALLDAALVAIGELDD